mmetsp:Transcript_11975/g.34564  ORF Transcript_11975/g.34564 Transcript_11975/m.34564 type:complete len:307 (+) Transcript_11975:2048-2968(+)
MTVLPDDVGAQTIADSFLSMRSSTRHCQSSSRMTRLYLLRGGRRSCMSWSWNLIMSRRSRSCRAFLSSLRNSCTSCAAWDMLFLSGFFLSPPLFFLLFLSPSSLEEASLYAMASASAGTKAGCVSIAQSTSKASAKSPALSEASRIMISLRSIPTGVAGTVISRTSLMALNLPLGFRMSRSVDLAALSSFSQSAAICFLSLSWVFCRAISSFLESLFCLPPPLPPPPFFLPPLPPPPLAAAAAGAGAGSAAAVRRRCFSLAQASRGSKMESGARLRSTTGMRLLFLRFLSRRLMICQYESVGILTQ